MKRIQTTVHYHDMEFKGVIFVEGDNQHLILPMALAHEVWSTADCYADPEGKLIDLTRYAYVDEADFLMDDTFLLMEADAKALEQTKYPNAGVYDARQ